MSQKLWCLLLFLLLNSTGFAQLFADYNFKFTNYTTQHGLVHNFTRKCRQDSKGFLWVITQNGLSRFDGKTFKNFQHIKTDSNSLPFNDLLDMAIDGDDRIWVGYATGLCYYDPPTKRFVKIKNVDQAQSLVYDSKRNCIWFSSLVKGLQKISIPSMALSRTAFAGPFLYVPFALNVDAEGSVWVGVERSAALQYHPGTDSFQFHEAYQWARKIDSRPDSTVVFTSWWNGVDVLDLRSKQTHNYQLDPRGIFGNPILEGTATSSALVAANLTFIASHNRGVILFDFLKSKIIKWFRYDPAVKSGLINDYNSSIYSDRAGIIWLCSWYGLSKINPQEQQFQSVELPALRTEGFNLVAGIVDDPYDSTVAWMAVTGLGIAKFSKQHQSILQWYYHDPVRDYDWVWPINLLRDAQNRLWAGTYGGLICIDRGRVSRHEIKYDNRFTYIEGSMLAKDGTIWTWGETLSKFDPVKKISESYKLNMAPKSPVESFGQVAELNDSTMLLTCSKGLYTFHRQSKIFTQISTPGINPKLNSLAMVGQQAFLGGEGGLYRYDFKTKTCQRLGEAEGIISINYSSVLKDSNQKIWIYTLAGLFRFDPLTNAFKKFTAADGIYNNSTDRSVLFEYRNDMYIGYRMAYTRFNPLKADANNEPSTPLIDEIRVNNVALSVQPQQEQLSLHWNKNTLSFDFTAIDYNNSDRVQFACILQGFETEWKTLGLQRTVSYSNLAPGDYMFKVKACNSSGLWNEKVAAFSFSIQAPVQQRWWFRTILVALFLGLVYVLYRYNINRIRRKQKEKIARQQIEIKNYKQRLEMEQIISFFSGSLLSKKTIVEVLDEVAKNLIGKMGFEDCMIYLWNDDKTVLIQYAGYGSKGSVSDAGAMQKYNIAKGRGIVGAAVDGGHAIFVNDTSVDSRYFTADEMLRGSELCVPLKDGDEVIGAINIENKATGFFTPYHQDIVSTIAAMTVNKLKAVESANVLHKKQLELSQTSRRLAETELSLLRSQMNPHFIFNSLNSIQKYIWENKEEDAAEYLANFAKLMRAILENSRKETVTLTEEISVLKLYIDLEHRRSNAGFNYSVNVAPHLIAENILIAPLIMQPFIENAIWHGLNPKQGRGNLSIHIFQDDNNLVCEIEDDGVGRFYKKEYGGLEKKSLGIDITRQRIENLVHGTSQKARLLITDKQQYGKPTGTKVVITLPLQKSYHA